MVCFSIVVKILQVLWLSESLQAGGEALTGVMGRGGSGRWDVTAGLVAAESSLLALGVGERRGSDDWLLTTVRGVALVEFESDSSGLGSPSSLVCNTHFSETRTKKRGIKNSP